MLDDMTTSDLQSIESRAQDALNTACSQAARDKQIVDCIDKLTTSSSLLKEFNALAYVSPDVAEKVLQAALGALVMHKVCWPSKRSCADVRIETKVCFELAEQAANRFATVGNRTGRSPS